MPLTIYRGVDFHARQHTVARYPTTDGKIHLGEFEEAHDEVYDFNSSLTVEVVVRIEAGGYGIWFVELTEGRITPELTRRHTMKQAPKPSA